MADRQRHWAVIEDDLPGIYAHIARDNPGAAERVLNAVEQTFEMLGQRPESGVVYPTRNPRLHGLRMFPVIGFRNYLIFYRYADDAVRILYVTHGARHLLRLFRREERT